LAASDRVAWAIAAVEWGIATFGDAGGSDGLDRGLVDTLVVVDESPTRRKDEEGRQDQPDR
jgi:hypothetical protein